MATNISISIEMQLIREMNFKFRFPQSRRDEISWLKGDQMTVENVDFPSSFSSHPFNSPTVPPTDKFINIRGGFWCIKEPWCCRKSANRLHDSLQGLSDLFRVNVCVLKGLILRGFWLSGRQSCLRHMKRPWLVSCFTNIKVDNKFHIPFKLSMFFLEQQISLSLDLLTWDGKRCNLTKMTNVFQLLTPKIFALNGKFWHQLITKGTLALNSNGIDELHKRLK